MEFEIPEAHIGLLRQLSGTPADGEIPPSVIQCYREYRILSDRIGTGDSIPTQVLALITFMGMKSDGVDICPPPERTLADRINAGEVKAGALLLAELKPGLKTVKYVRDSGDGMITIDYEGDEIPIDVNKVYLQGAPEAPTSY